MTHVDFWFDPASSYSYLAVARVEREAVRAGVALVWRPFLLGPIFKAQGLSDSPFNLFPVKGQYMWRDMERCAAKAGLPFARPTIFPQRSVLAARVILALESEGLAAEGARRIFHANFADNRDIADAAILVDIVRSMGLDGDATLARAVSPEIKEKLRDETDQALRAGVFGAPTFAVGTELFWGNDRLDDALACARSASAPA